ncbi:hypothetical protein Fcan01_00485 [Folsomia candida]|uniref:Uncharacterized protein n=1 Tax=Folsomia candida TaxID=158441 RepID=A0A226F0U6_FOLCA|nr:hypothetical protein Fcan01_00485 [Folsomia candida]
MAKYAIFAILLAIGVYWTNGSSIAAKSISTAVGDNLGKETLSLVKKKRQNFNEFATPIGSNKRKRNHETSAEISDDVGPVNHVPLVDADEPKRHHEHKAGAKRPRKNKYKRKKGPKNSHRKKHKPIGKHAQKSCASKKCWA